MSKNGLLTLIRITKTLFSEKAQARMDPESIRASLSCLDDFDYSPLGVESSAIDIYQDPKKPQMCKATKMTNVEFVKNFCMTPTAMLKHAEQDLQDKPLANPTVTLSKKSSTRFQAVGSFNPREINQFKGESLSDFLAKESALSFAKEKIEKMIEIYEKELANLLKDKPILPEEKLFMGLKVITYHLEQSSEKEKKRDETCLMRFYNLIDKIEFQLRYKQPIDKLNTETLAQISRFIHEEINLFTPKTPFFEKIFGVLGLMTSVIQIEQDTMGTENYLTQIKQFLDKALNSPFKDQLNCLLPKKKAKEIANKNLKLRSSLLLSQFKTKTEISKELINELKRIDNAFQENNWLQANALLCNVLQTPIFETCNFEIESNFIIGKLASSILSLADFFHDVVARSVEYRWINFIAMKACSEYLMQENIPLKKGELNPFNQWVEAAATAGWPELREGSQNLNLKIKQLIDIKESFETANKSRIKEWIKNIESNELNSFEYATFCNEVELTLGQIRVVLLEISTEIQILQTSISLVGHVKDIPQIAPNQLAKQLNLLNERITNSCFPFIYFLQNFANLMEKQENTPKVSVIPLFETDTTKLLCQHEALSGTEEVSEIRIEMDDSQVEPAPIPSSSESRPDSLQAKSRDQELEEDLATIFNTKNRRKILEQLHVFFRKQKVEVQLESGKGSHIKLYIGKKPIIIPHSRELKVGTAGSIQSDILNELRKLV